MKIKTRTVLLNFILCNIITIIIDAILWNPAYNTHTYFLGRFFYLLLNWVPLDFIYHVLIYFLYFFLVVYFFKLNIKPYIRIPGVVILGIIYFLAILFLDWQLSKARYHSFNDYLKEFSHYLVFTIVLIFQISFSAIWNKFRTRQQQN